MSTIPKDIATIPQTVSDSYVSLDDFLRLYSDVEDGFKYEWNNGKIEKTTKMDAQQSTLQDILFRIFLKTKLFQEGGMLVAETDMRTSICRGKRICSAESAIKGFKISIEDLFDDIKLDA